jgi:hypothetical protein
MSTGTIHLSGIASPAAARLGACPAALATTTGIAARTRTTYAVEATQAIQDKWLHGSNGMPVSPVFVTDRPTRRPLECFP